MYFSARLIITKLLTNSSIFSKASFSSFALLISGTNYMSFSRLWVFLSSFFSIQHSMLGVRCSMFIYYLRYCPTALKTSGWEVSRCARNRSERTIGQKKKKSSRSKSIPTEIMSLSVSMRCDITNPAYPNSSFIGNAA